MKRITIELDGEVYGYAPDGEPILNSFYVCDGCYQKTVLALDVIREEEIKEVWKHICHICTEREVGNAT